VTIAPDDVNPCSTLKIHFHGLRIGRGHYQETPVERSAKVGQPTNYLVGAEEELVERPVI